MHQPTGEYAERLPATEEKMRPTLRCHIRSPPAASIDPRFVQRRLVMTAPTPVAEDIWPGDRASQVVLAAARAWALHGDLPEISRSAVGQCANLASLAATRARRVEYVVEFDHTPVWKTLAALTFAESWQPCALVPLALLGVAHDQLREHGYELQPWWPDDGEIAFGSVEIA